MAAQLAQFTARVSGGAWTKIMGQGIDGIASGDEVVFSANLHNTGARADLLIAYIDGNTAPSTDTDNGVFKVAGLPTNSVQPINRKILAAGWTCWVKCASEIQIEASGRKAATA